MAGQWHQVKNEAQAECVREAFQKENSVSFVLRRKGDDFLPDNVECSHALSSIQLDHTRIRFQGINNGIPDIGIPFIIRSEKTYDCLFGPDQHLALKHRQAALREEQLQDDHPRPVNSRKKIQTRKKGCPAKIQMKELICFPDFKPQRQTEKLRKMSSKSLRNALLSGQQIKWERRIYVKVPDDTEHLHHPTGELSWPFTMSKVVKETPPFPHFDAEFTPNYGYVRTWEDARELKEFFELRKTLRFHALRTSTTFGKTDILLGKRKKYKWVEADQYVAGGAIPFDGVPFIILDKNVYECEYGVDHKLKRKAARGNKQNLETDVEGNTKKKQGAEGEKVKKRNCPAKIRMKEIMKFPDFKIDKDTRYNRNKEAEKLSEAIATGAVRGERRIYMYFPTDSEHTGHHLRSQVCATKQHVDERVLCLIDHLVEEGVTSVDEVSQQINLCVQEAETTSKSGEGITDGHTKLCCPEEGDIKYHIQAAQVIHTYSKLQPKDLNDHVAQLRLVPNGHNVFFREQSPGKLLLLVHQTLEQQQTIESYPSEKYFVDSTCKTTRGALPLILISVQANGIHQIVGSAILQKKSSILIQEALQIFKSWNSTMKPLSFTTEFEEEDIQGVKGSFQGVPVLLCDYHRISAWNKWITETIGIPGSKGALMSILEALANASTKERYHQLVDQLKGSSYWKEDERISTWFGGTWLSRYSMWAQAFFPEASSPSLDSPDESVDQVDQDIALTNSLRERCLQSLQRLGEIAQQETTSPQDLAHLWTCLESVEQEYASLVADHSQEVGEQGDEEAQACEQVEVRIRQEPDQGEHQVEEEHLMEAFQTGSVKRRRVETDSVQTGNIKVGQEPVSLDMFVQAVEIVYRNQEALNQDLVSGEVHQEMVVSEVNQEMVSNEVNS